MKGGSGDVGPTGRSTRGAAKEDTKQTKITDKLRKTVRFGEEEKERLEMSKEVEDFKVSVTEELRKIRLEKVELIKLKAEIENRLSDLGDIMVRFEKRLTRLEELESERDEGRSVRESSNGTDGELGERTGEGAAGSQWSLVSGRSKFSVSSRFSITEREMRIMKRVAYEKDRSDRENNVVIRGWRSQGGDLKEEVKKFLEGKLDFKGEVEAAWNSGGVSIARLGREEKIEVMKRKSKLAGTRIFIENDLSYEDRKKQEEINMWAKEKREGGMKLKVGQGRFLYEGRWFKWEGKDRAEEVSRKLAVRMEEGRGVSSKGQEKREDLR